MDSDKRPATAPDFLLSRPHHSVRTQGWKATYPDPFEASTALRNGSAELIVGAIPFNTSLRAALMEPISVVTYDGPFEPPAYFRGQEAAESLAATEVTVATSKEEHQARVSAAIQTMHRTGLKKVVLARAADVYFAEPIDPLLVAARFIDLSANRDGYAVDLSATGREEDQGTAFVGSSPEMLVARAGETVSAFPLAGSAARTGNKAVDARTAAELAGSAKNLEEHALVVEHYRRILAPLCSTLEIPDEPIIHETTEMIHLGTPIEGTLVDDGFSALDLALMLHPTPAIGGTPTEDAVGIIESIEEPREFYSGAVGWCDANGDGEYMVAIRCACVDGATARVWAGGGIVDGSDPHEEAEETTAKLQTALRALNVPAAMREI